MNVITLNLVFILKMHRITTYSFRYVDKCEIGKKEKVTMN